MKKLIVILTLILSASAFGSAGAPAPLLPGQVNTCIVWPLFPSGWPILYPC